MSSGNKVAQQERRELTLNEREADIIQLIYLPFPVKTSLGSQSYFLARRKAVGGYKHYLASRVALFRFTSGVWNSISVRSSDSLSFTLIPAESKRQQTRV